MPAMRGARQLFAAAIAAGLLFAALGGCGGSSKPGYCSDVSDFESAVSGLKDVKPVQNGTSSVKSAIQKVEDTGKAVVDSAQSDFPDQTKAIDQSLDTLGETLKQLGDPSTATQTIAKVPGQVSALSSAAGDFKSATDSKCK